MSLFNEKEALNDGGLIVDLIKSLALIGELALYGYLTWFIYYIFSTRFQIYETMIILSALFFTIVVPAYYLIGLSFLEATGFAMSLAVGDTLAI